MSCAAMTSPVIEVEDVPAQLKQAPFCDTYKPVRWSQLDTPETIAQIKADNAVWTALGCATDPKPETAP